MGTAHILSRGTSRHHRSVATYRCSSPGCRVSIMLSKVEVPKSFTKETVGPSTRDLKRPVPRIAIENQ
ncbi:hypothetical protein GCM10012283_30590 [Phycicoccus endophyticus]|nr:hypothetical protein GCM10012283_30590 [Phycicoccus endophyticus]